MSIILNGTTGITTPGITNTGPFVFQGTIELPAGTVTAPSLTTTGDTNTGIYFPAADTIAFTEGGVESARLDSSGNLGLGVTPSAWVDAKAIDIGSYGAISSDIVTSAGISVSYNAYGVSATSWKYKNSYPATRYTQEDGLHKWFSAASGTAGNTITFTQAMTLDASGRLGIGPTSPSYPLEVSGASGSNIAVFRTNDGTAANNTGMGFYGVSSATAASRSAVMWLDADGANFAGGDYFVIDKKGNSGVVNIINASNAAMTFWTADTERARITSDGQFLLGTTSFTSGGIQKLIAIDGPSNCGITFNRSGAVTAFIYTYSTVGFRVETGGSYAGVEIVPGGTGGVSLSSGATSWSSMSDERYKSDLKPIENACSKIAAVRAVTGRYKTDQESNSRAFLIAQDVQSVLPEAVDDSNPEKLSLRYTEVIPLLVAAIKELKSEIDQLKGK